MSINFGKAVIYTGTLSVSVFFFKINIVKYLLPAEYMFNRHVKYHMMILSIKPETSRKKV